MFPWLDGGVIMFSMLELERSKNVLPEVTSHSSSSLGNVWIYHFLFKGVDRCNLYIIDQRRYNGWVQFELVVIVCLCSNLISVQVS